jgi:two-component system sensor histidine kinase ChvG
VALVRLRRHLAGIRYRLLLINLLVAVVPIVGVVFARMHERQLLAALEADMIHQAQLVAALEPRGAALTRVAQDTRTRIRIVDAAGAVAADSHPGTPEPTTVAARPELRRALAGRYGAATRRWGDPAGARARALDLVYLFVAVPVRDARGAVTGAVYVSRSTREVKLQLLQLRAWMLRVLLATIAGTALITLLLATTIAHPLRRLTRRAARIAAHAGPTPGAGADDEVAALEARDDELGQLARALAAMTTELERRARDARTLAADLSHEFKTPLAGLRGAAELLRDGAAEDPSTRDRFLAMIEDDVARLDRLVSRLLDLARVDDDRAAPAPVDLAALAADAAARPWPAPIAVTAAGPRVAFGRAAALATAVDNLLANACQHATPGTSIALTVAPSGGAIRISVANHGPPLSPAAQAKVWDRFYSTRVAAGGSGLGLAIVRAVALAHGGGHGVVCEGGVTTFWFDVAR